ncbi:response regulator [Hydrogenophaga sp. BPS33]|uniref:response regulator n=1 Tax=Hydrogenophaga sp. BPS33 TaxID=2651974 RepID=UPI00131FD3B1|nr:response regulator [Hydrogenophaga sp. BPS33]QHE87229.1 response regulator [Hydrogenophaga sp. BPS33]
MSDNFTILLVEDEAPKRAHIERFVLEVVSTARVFFARSVNAAMDALDASLPDLMLLDMSLPTFDIDKNEAGGRPQGFGGKEVMRYMKLSGISCPVIVITGYEAFPREAGKPVDLDQIRKELAAEFPSMLVGLLHYNSTYEEWKNELRESLSKRGIQ